MNSILQTLIICLFITFIYNKKISPNVKNFFDKNIDYNPIQTSQLNGGQLPDVLMRNSYTTKHLLNRFPGLRRGFNTGFDSRDRFQPSSYAFDNSNENSGFNSKKENNAFDDFLETEVNSNNNKYVPIKQDHQIRYQSLPNSMNSQNPEFNIHNNQDFNKRVNTQNQNSGLESQGLDENMSDKCLKPHFVFIGIPVPQSCDKCEKKAENDIGWKPIRAPISTTTTTSTMSSVSKPEDQQSAQKHVVKADLEKAKQIAKMIELLDGMDK